MVFGYIVLQCYDFLSLLRWYLWYYEDRRQWKSFCALIRNYANYPKIPRNLPEFCPNIAGSILPELDTFLGGAQCPPTLPSYTYVCCGKTTPPPHQTQLSRHSETMYGMTLNNIIYYRYHIIYDPDKSAHKER